MERMDIVKLMMKKINEKLKMLTPISVRQTVSVAKVIGAIGVAAVTILYGAMGCGDTIVNPEPKDGEKDTVYVCDGKPQNTPCEVKEPDTPYTCNGIKQSTPCIEDPDTLYTCNGVKQPTPCEIENPKDTSKTYLCDGKPQNTPCKEDEQQYECEPGRTGESCALYQCLDGDKLLGVDDDVMYGPCPRDLDRFCPDGKEWYNSQCLYRCETPEYAEFDYYSHEPCRVPPKSIEDVINDAVEKCGVAYADELYTPLFAEVAESDPDGVAEVVRSAHSTCLSSYIARSEDLAPFSARIEFTQEDKGKLTKMELLNVHTSVPVCTYVYDGVKTTRHISHEGEMYTEVQGYYPAENKDTILSDGQRLSKVGFNSISVYGEDIYSIYCDIEQR